MTMIITFNAVPVEKNGLVAALIGVILTIGGIVGPLLSGAICSNTTWRWIFWLNLPVGGLALAGFIIAWPKDKTRKAFTKSAFSAIDWLGSILLLAASILLIYCMQEAGTGKLEWDSAIIGSLLTLVPATFIGFVMWQLFLSTHPEWKVQIVFPVQLAVQRVIGGSIA